jgi:hypothetical protein
VSFALGAAGSQSASTALDRAGAHTPKKLRMLGPLGFSAFFPFDSEEFRSRDLNGNGLIVRGAKDGLISSMGKCVFGFASPVAIRFATAGVISLCTVSWQVG